ncbi:MAG: alpha-hydroxy acid oxidase [Gemmobacter sp.]|nr:alpha-hydroxy acid oxidase [Gemmobacter sp.]
MTESKSATGAPGYTAPAVKAPRAMRDILSLDDLEPAARRFLPTPVFGYVSGAAEDNLTRDDNRAAFRKPMFRPRVLRNVADRSMRTTLLGQTYEAPFGIAPMGMAALSAYRGDIVLARSARAAGIPGILSGSSLIAMEQVHDAAPGTWFQAYLPGETDRIEGLLRRAAGVGYETLVVTLDVPVSGNRENLVRAGFSSPLRPSLRLALQGLSRPRWLLGVWAQTLMRHGMPHFENSYAERGAPILSRNVLRDFWGRDHFDWTHIAHIRRVWRGPLILKGILHPDDVALARQHGADGVILSNHGGRQLDGAISPMRVLPQAVERAGDMPVMLDSGVRRGVDVIRALALGAKFVFVGRPFMYAAALAGDAGTAHAISILRAEIDRSLALLGLRDLSEVGPDILDLA